MSPKSTAISDAELSVMQTLWGADAPLTSAEIHEILKPQTDWSFSTVSTLLGRLVEKQAIGFEKRGKANYYHPLIAQGDYTLRETRSFLGKLYGGSVKKLLATLIASDELSTEDIDALRDQFKL